MHRKKYALVDSSLAHIVYYIKIGSLTLELRIMRKPVFIKKAIIMHTDVIIKGTADITRHITICN
jgi:hypothetical protein